MRKRVTFVLIVAALLTIALPLTSKRGEAHPGVKIPQPLTVPVLSSVQPPILSIVPGIVADEHPVKAGLLFDSATNKIVWEKGMFSSMPIASLTKLMTALLVLEDIRDGKYGWEAMVYATPEASGVGSSKLWMKPGQVFSVKDLMKSAMICSANDACYLLGEHSSGSENLFVERMNDRAHRLGMFNTYFSNSNGLPAPRRVVDNFSSPNDLLILSREILKFPEILPIASMNEEIIFAENQKFQLKNHNKLAIEYPEVDGLKTGYTRKAGFCIVATARKEDTRLIGIVLGAVSPLERNEFVADMFNKYYDNVLCVGKLERPNPSANLYAKRKVGVRHHAKVPVSTKPVGRKKSKED